MKTGYFLVFMIAFITLSAKGIVIKNERNEKVLDQLVEINNVPGLNFSIIYKNGKQFNYSSGYADTTEKIPLNEHHVLFSGSIGKTYAVAVLMQLIDEGRIELDKPFMYYFPKNNWLKNLPDIEDITVEMLLNHTSGLPRYINNEEVWKTVRENPDKVWTHKERLSYAFDMEPAHKPGKGWAYSDTNYLLIGMLIEQITGSEYYSVVKSRILDPAQLTQTHPAIRRDIRNLPIGYSNLDDFFNMPGIVVVNGEYIFNPQMENTGGGFASTTSDLAKWAKYYFESEFFSKELGEKIVTSTKQGAEISDNMACGMGSFIFYTSQGKAYGHTGFIPGFNAIFAYFPDEQLAVAMQINCDYARSNMSLMDYLLFILNNLSI